MKKYNTIRAAWPGRKTDSTGPRLNQVIGYTSLSWNISILYPARNRLESFLYQEKFLHAVVCNRPSNRAKKPG